MLFIKEINNDKADNQRIILTRKVVNHKKLIYETIIGQLFFVIRSCQVLRFSYLSSSSLTLPYDVSAFPIDKDVNKKVSE